MILIIKDLTIVKICISIVTIIMILINCIKNILFTYSKSNHDSNMNNNNQKKKRQNILNEEVYFEKCVAIYNKNEFMGNLNHQCNFNNYTANEKLKINNLPPSSREIIFIDEPVKTTNNKIYKNSGKIYRPEKNPYFSTTDSDKFTQSKKEKFQSLKNDTSTYINNKYNKNKNPHYDEEYYYREILSKNY